MVEIKAQAGDILKQETGALIVNLFEGVEKPGGATGAVDRALEGAISTLIAEGEFRGKRGEVALLHTLGKIPARRVLIIGLGREKEFSADVVRQVVAEACRYLRRIGVERAVTIAHGAGVGGLSPEESAQAVTEGALLGLYRFHRHKSADEEGRKEVRELVILDREEGKVPALQRGIERGRVLAEAANLCRDMVNEPANEMTPTRMAEVAREIAEREGLEVTILNRDQCQELGMGAFLGVARGSHQEPRFIVLRYWGDPENPGNSLGLLGKGITFDSGGISLKPAQGMEEMKGDMAGGASVLCAVWALARLDPRVNVTAIVPATENMPGGGAIKPGDILRAMNGKTIEVVNTDAEGRVVLADALCYAQRLGLARLVDVATLTGAIRVALGDVRMGVFGTDREWVDRVLKAGEKAGERMWPMPMDEDYREQIKSPVADIKNVGNRMAGAITAAFFLKEFAGDTPWAHLDIAGVAWLEKEKGVYVKGATGVPVRSLVQLAVDLAP